MLSADIPLILILFDYSFTITFNFKKLILFLMKQYHNYVNNEIVFMSFNKPKNQSILIFCLSKSTTDYNSEGNI